MSYNSNDNKFAKELYEKLRTNGIEVWKAPEGIKPGEIWLDAIDKAIRDAFALIVIVTSNSLQSHWVTYEWSSAISLNKTVFPVIVGDIKDQIIHDKLRSRQFTNLNHKDTYTENFDNLLLEIKRIESEYKLSSPQIPLKVPLAVQNAVSDIDSGDTYKRLNAVQNLVQLNHPVAIDLLYQAAYESYYRDVRIASTLNLHVLTQLTDEQEKKLLPVLIEALEYGNEDEQFDAHTILVNLDQLAIPQLLERWCNRYPIHLTDAIQKVLLYISEPVIPFMIELFKTTDVETRKRIFWFFEDLKSKATVPFFILALKDENVDIRYFSTREIGRKKIREAVPTLIAMLADYAIPDGMSRPISDWALLALADIGTEEGFEAITPELIRSLNDTSIKIIDGYKVRRCDEIVQLINRIPELASKPDIKQALDKYLSNKKIEK